MVRLINFKSREQKLKTHYSFLSLVLAVSSVLTTFDGLVIANPSNEVHVIPPVLMAIVLSFALSVAMFLFWEWSISHIDIITYTTPKRNYVVFLLVGLVYGTVIFFASTYFSIISLGSLYSVKANMQDVINQTEIVASKTVESTGKRASLTETWLRDKVPMFTTLEKLEQEQGEGSNYQALTLTIAELKNKAREASLYHRTVKSSNLAIIRKLKKLNEIAYTVKKGNGAYDHYLVGLNEQKESSSLNFAEYIIEFSNQLNNVKSDLFELIMINDQLDTILKNFVSSLDAIAKHSKDALADIESGLYDNKPLFKSTYKKRVTWTIDQIDVLKTEIAALTKDSASLKLQEELSDIILYQASKAAMIPKYRHFGSWGIAIVLDYFLFIFFIFSFLIRLFNGKNIPLQNEQV